MLLSKITEVRNNSYGIIWSILWKFLLYNSKVFKLFHQVWRNIGTVSHIEDYSYFNKPYFSTKRTWLLKCLLLFHVSISHISSISFYCNTLIWALISYCINLFGSLPNVRFLLVVSFNLVPFVGRVMNRSGVQRSLSERIGITCKVLGQRERNAAFEGLKKITWNAEQEKHMV